MRRYLQPVSPLDYRNQAAVPGHASFSKDWARWSEQARSRLQPLLDVRYGEGPLETCDVFGSPVDGAPVFVFVHGGWWYFLDKADFSFVATEFAKRDAVCICLNYPLAPHARIEEIVSSLQRAMLWVHGNVARFGGDPNRIAVSGHSAGGHLSTMLSLTDWTAAGAPADLVKVNASISGLFDLYPILGSPHNEHIRMDAATAAIASPVDLVADFGVRHIVAVGARETTGFLWQHAMFLNTCRDADVEVEGLMLPNEHHFSVINQLADGQSPLFSSVMEALHA